MTKIHSRSILVLMFVAGPLLLIGCGGASSTTNYDTSSSEVIGGMVAGTAGSADSGGSVVTMNGEAYGKNPQLIAGQLLNLLAEPKAYASQCSSSAAVTGATCAGAVMSLSLNGCSGLVGTWNGSLTLTYNSSAACSAAASSGLMSMGAGNSVTITTTNTSLTVGNYVVNMSSASSGYNSSVSGGLQITCGASGCATSRTVNILGVNRTLTLNSATLFNHTFNTPTAFTITGTGASKQITGGSLQLQHNIAKFVATSTIASTLGFSSSCCVPTSGSMTTTFSSGKSGSETLTFNSTCGSAKVGSSAVTIGYCL